MLHLLTGKIRPLIQAQITLPLKVKQNQLQHLNNLLAKLEEAISVKVRLFIRKKRLTIDLTGTRDTKKLLGHGGLAAAFVKAKANSR